MTRDLVKELAQDLSRTGLNISAYDATAITQAYMIAFPEWAALGPSNGEIIAAKMFGVADAWDYPLMREVIPMIRTLCNYDGEIVQPNEVDAFGLSVNRPETFGAIIEALIKQDVEDPDSKVKLIQTGQCVNKLKAAIVVFNVKGKDLTLCYGPFEHVIENEDITARVEIQGAAISNMIC